MNNAEVADLLPYLTEAERAELNALLTKDTRWRPLPGPQSEAYHSKADITGYGGAAGGGKTDLACGLAINEHHRSIIFRRLGTEITAIEDRIEELVGSKDGYNGQKMIWKLPAKDGGSPRQIEFGATQHAGDEKKYQGRPHDLIIFDEAANFLEMQVRFLLGWMRTVNPDQRCRALLTFNPPTSAEGRWLIAFFGPWLDDTHPNPAKPGELRWFATVDGKDIEVASGEPFDHHPSDGSVPERIQPLSRTFIPSRITDNPYLVGTGYMATLQSLPEPLRSQMLKGDFKAGIEDDPWQIIPTLWIDAAMARWEAKHAKGPMDAMGVDPSRGGRDETTIARRHGTWFDTLIGIPGDQATDGPTVAGQIIAHRRDRAVVHIDAIGVGSSPYDFLIGNSVQTVGVIASNKTDATTKSGNLRFANVRAELWWRMREALDPMNPDPISLPPDTMLRGDLASAKWALGTTGIRVELKDEIKARIGRSPDRGDAVVLALMSTVKRDAPSRRINMPNYGSI